MRQFAFHLIADNPDYDFQFEEFKDDQGNQMILAHIAVKRFSPSVLKQMRREWREIRTATPVPVFAIEPRYQDDKWARFVQPFGFQYFRTIDRGEEDLRRMFVSRQEDICLNEQDRECNQD